MRSAARPLKFDAQPVGLVRASAVSEVVLPPWPDLAEPDVDTPTWTEWLRKTVASEQISEVLDHANPSLSREVHTLCAADRATAKDTYSTAVSVVRFLQRLRRPTPLGLISGVAPASIGTEPRWRWGGSHKAIARVSAAWLDRVITDLERHPDLLPRLPVIANSTITVRGGHIIVPYLVRGRSSPGTKAIDVQLLHTSQARTALDAARTPILLKDLATLLQGEYPGATPAQIESMLTVLVERRVLLTSLHAPFTEPDALAHLLHQLHAAHAASIPDLAPMVATLAEVRTGLEAHNRLSATESRPIRDQLTTRMRTLSDCDGHPLAIDLRLDAEVRLPEPVVREVERAAWALMMLSDQPFGTPAWKAYHQRFYERFGIGSLVPVLDVVADSGIGWPDGYPGTMTAERPRPLMPCDRALLSLAQTAVLDGRHEVVLDDDLIARLDKSNGKPRPPSHLELCVRIHADDTSAMKRGHFTVEVVGVSRGAGTLQGRFLSVLDPGDRAPAQQQLRGLPTADEDTVTAQMSFPPLKPSDGHVARAVQTQPIVISLAEHRPASDNVLQVADLAIGCDGRRMYLAVPKGGYRVEPVGVHAVNLHQHTPPLARLLIELGRAQNTRITMFDWGAGSSLPFLPAVRYGRIILSPARWRIDASELPIRQDSWQAWGSAWHDFRLRRRLPRFVRLAEPKSRLPLDLDQAAHLVLLRDRLAKDGHAIVWEAAGEHDAGWCGGRPHEIVVPLTARQPMRWPKVPKPSLARVIGRGQGNAPAASNVVLAKVYGDFRRQNEILTRHLPSLLSAWEQPPHWWFLRFRDPDHHLRLRFALNDPADFGLAAQRISQWAERLHQAGIVREVIYATSYPETGRWGSDAAYRAAEEVFRADAGAVVTQLTTGLGTRPDWPYWRALVAAQNMAIAIGFRGSVQSGMQWLIDHIRVTAPKQHDRPLRDETVRICDPSDDWSALRSLPGGSDIVNAWQARSQALAAYRVFLPGPHTHGIDTDDVCRSLLHAHFVRAYGVDFDTEAVCHYLARSAAQAWTAQHPQAQP